MLKAFLGDFEVSVPAKLAPASLGERRDGTGQVQELPSLCRLSAELGLVVGVPGKPAWARSMRVCVGKGYPTGKDPRYLLQLALANCLSHSFEVVSPPGAVMLLLPFSHLLSLVI